MPTLDELLRASALHVRRMTPEERDAMYREQCRSRNLFDGRSTKDLKQELAEVHQRMAISTAWGASVAALIEWENDLQLELRRRGR